ncbi:TPA: transcriptional regulator [Pasteurella multocida]|uniref:Transcriptional regulator n=1 Tax=Histophilus somni TaxID=731 RepID=A0AAX2S1G5_HISSO|nr:transcriptional regulator [Pasteurella multocida]TEW25299.1 transcriptional regulator [Histophilus somni]NNI08633.1 transcriptional regulator [Pasteurella multocida]NNI27998.1 transcriptional regulator [Pasteurella multocida]NNI30130.1 transcriptional regulator [Pasteurella multocida]
MAVFCTQNSAKELKRQAMLASRLAYQKAKKQ